MNAKFCFFAFLMLLLTKSSTAQDNAQIEQISVNEVNGKAYLYWVISSGSSCIGIGIERSEDSISFSEIHFIPGVCGNISSPQAYDFTDNNPITNKPSYYRLRLGNGGYSVTLPITIIATNEAGYLVTPNPATHQTSLYFQNPKRESSLLIIYASSGTEVLRKTTNENSFPFDVITFSAGVYIFTITSEHSFVNGKFVVAR